MGRCQLDELSVFPGDPPFMPHHCAIVLLLANKLMMMWLMWMIMMMMMMMTGGTKLHENYLSHI